MKKNYILDTNVLLHDPKAILHFEDNTVILPISVIEEIDTFKRDLSELGRNARHVARLLDERSPPRQSFYLRRDHWVSRVEELGWEGR